MIGGSWGRWRRAATCAAVALIAASSVACGGGKKHTEDTLPPETSSSTTTTTTIDVTKVPAVIDVAYVQAVIDKLDPVIGDAVRHLAQKKAPDAEFVQLLDAVYEVDQSKREQESYGRLIAEDPIPLRADAGNPTATITELVDSSPTCIVAKGHRDFGPIFVAPRADRDTEGVIELHIKRPERDPTRKNPTTWAIAGEGPLHSTTIPTDPCP